MNLAPSFNCQIDATSASNDLIGLSQWLDAWSGRLKSIVHNIDGYMHCVLASRSKASHESVYLNALIESFNQSHVMKKELARLADSVCASSHDRKITVARTEEIITRLFTMYKRNFRLACLYHHFAL